MCVHVKSRIWMMTAAVGAMLRLRRCDMGFGEGWLQTPNTEHRDINQNTHSPRCEATDWNGCVYAPLYQFGISRSRIIAFERWTIAQQAARAISGIVQKHAWFSRLKWRHKQSGAHWRIVFNWQCTVFIQTLVFGGRRERRERDVIFSGHFLRGKAFMY